MPVLPASRRSFLAGSGAVIAALVGAPVVDRTAWGQSPPALLRLLCGAPAGAIPDLVARAYADGLGRSYVPKVIVENRPGAAGQLAIRALGQSDADGSTALLVQGAVVTINPYLYTKLGYDPFNDLAAVSLAAETTFGLAVGSAVPNEVRTLGEFLQWSRVNAASCSYGSPGIGTMPHLLAVLLFRDARVDAQHVPYVSGPVAINDVLGGRLPAVVLPDGVLHPHHTAGKLRVLAVTAESRSRFMPDVPTFAEEGYAALTAHEWLGFFVRGNTPPALLERLSAAIREAGRIARLVDGLAELSIQAGTCSPAALDQRIAAEGSHWQRVIQSLGIRLE